MASGKPSTRFPIEWHVKKGFVWSNTCLVSNMDFLVGPGLVCIGSEMKFLEFLEIPDSQPKFTTSPENRVSRESG